MKPTRADREAVWMAYWDDPVRDRCEMSRALHQWLHDGVMAAGAVDVTVRLQRLAEDRARQRTDLLRLGAQVAIKVGEHEYARGTRDRERTIKSAINVGVERAYQFITLYGRHMREARRTKGCDYTLLNLIEQLDRGELRPPEKES